VVGGPSTAKERGRRSIDPGHSRFEDNPNAPHTPGEVAPGSGSTTKG